MADRTDLPKIKPTKQPTYFNREAGGWALLGNLVGELSGALLARGNAAAAGISALVGTAIGGAYGAVKGHNRQERELVEGRIVKDPTYLNSGIFSGLISGLLLAVPVNMLLATAKIPVRTLLMVSQSAMLVGGVIGSINRKNSMQSDYDQALQLRDQQNTLAKSAAVEIGKVQEQPITYKNTVTKEEADLLESRKKEEHKSHAAAHAHHAEHTSHAENHEHHESHQQAHHAAKEASEHAETALA